MRNDDHDTREMWHRVRRFFFKNIRPMTRFSIVVILLFVALHALHPDSIEWLGEKIHFARPSLPAVLSLAIAVLLLERVFILEEVVRTPFIRLYSTQERMYRELADMVERDGAKTAVLLQYSCNTGLPLVRALLDSSADVTVYMQNPSTAATIGSSLQHNRIQSHIDALPSELQDAIAGFTAFTIPAPVSVAAARIDQDVIAVGWYTYLHVDFSNQRHVAAGDKVKVVAHDVPCVVARRGSAEFEVLNRFFDRLLQNYRANATEIRFNESRDLSH
ncbi:MAG TPA: hypothetical protein VMU84_01850 [Thermoanaerobaculia bacterium]|nr:hypothetical protein [Thermoanaerobaculia bacterium]